MGVAGAVRYAGRSFDGPLRETALLIPHGGPDPGGGPSGFQTTKTAAHAGLTAAMTGEDAWRPEHTGRTGPAASAAPTRSGDEPAPPVTSTRMRPRQARADAAPRDPSGPS
ncbi:hypothetical protein ACIBBD_08350 [Streptomyces sp. NPDC051315]|uniref:hypothetical protein n=1 Tax=Streptomyces sp. NPDC051315 TaxID=3365650 RepID=UPI0037BDB4B0